MVNHTSVLRPGEPPEPARPVPVFWKAAGSRLLVDRLTRRLVTLGGVLTPIGSILAILFVIAADVYPLFKQPKATRLRDTVPAGIAAPLALGVDEYREVAFLVTPRGIRFIDMKGGTLSSTPALLAWRARRSRQPLPSAVGPSPWVSPTDARFPSRSGSVSPTRTGSAS